MSITGEEMRVLSILDAIARNSRASQRDLSRVTGLNLAKVNFLLRALAADGVVGLSDAATPNGKRRYRYALTQRGHAERSRLTLGLARRSWSEYRGSLERLGESLARLRANGCGRVVLVGDNEVAQMIVEACRSIAGLDVIAIFDPEPASTQPVVSEGWGNDSSAVPVVTALDGLEFDRAVLCVDSGSASARSLSARGLDSEQVWQV